GEAIVMRSKAPPGRRPGRAGPRKPTAAPATKTNAPTNMKPRDTDRASEVFVAAPAIRDGMVAAAASAPTIHASRLRPAPITSQGRGPARPERSRPSRAATPPD